MRIQHNIMAMNSYRNLSGNNSALSKNLEKLSSGYRINRAGDDAAGLAISEKMRAQIAGLDQAQKNAQSGINMVKTAEGALTEVHDMLNRMTTLATQSANGTYSNTDREKLQAEINALTEEIDRIADNSNFNGTKLLDGSLAQKGAAGVGSVTVDLSKLQGNLLSGIVTADATKGEFYTKTALADISGLTADNVGDKLDFTFEYVDNDGNHKQTTISFEIALKEGQTDATQANALVLKAADGSTYAASGTAATVGGDEIADALVSEFAKNDELSANFKVLEDGTTDGLFDFTAAVAGSEGATLTAITQTKTAAKDGNVTHTDINVTVGDNAENGVAGKSTAVDSFKTLDLSKATTWDGTAENLEDAIFEINGQKFVFVDKNVTLNDKMKDMLAEAGVGNNYVTTGATNTVAAADVTKMADIIKTETGLLVEEGTLTQGATNVWVKKGEKDEGGTAANASTVIALKDATVATKEKVNGGMDLQIGADAVETIKVTVESMKAKDLGIEKLNIGDVESANKAIDTIKNAIEQVSVTRGNLGAIQNRLEHTINNLGVMEENIQDAESNIRDTDIADEMMAYTKNNILIQSAQAMLAQANQVPQGVLQLMG